MNRSGETWKNSARALACFLLMARLPLMTSEATPLDQQMDFRHADPVGNCTVFNIKGNHYRLIAGVRYEMQKVFVLKVMTHKQYDVEDWKNECRCY